MFSLLFYCYTHSRILLVCIIFRIVTDVTLGHPVVKKYNLFLVIFKIKYLQSAEIF
jgi:hypothetical protein